MATRCAVVHGEPGGTVPRLPDEGPVLLFDWVSDRRNTMRDLTQLMGASRYALAPRLADLLDVATAVYLADIATVRGVREEWVRHITLDVPVRDVPFWDSVRDSLHHLLYILTRDAIVLNFHPLSSEPSPAPAPGPHAPDVDCVCLLSGGLDSLAGAAMLLHTGRRPLFVSHLSGNPTVSSVQRGVVSNLGKHWPDQFTWAPIRIAPDQHNSGALPFPAPEMRENSRRARSFLFTTLGVIAACAAGVEEVYLCENGILTVALPLSPARSGSLSTRSTHPAALKLLSEIVTKAGVDCCIENPFIYQTKGEILRSFLKPVLSPAEITASVSCWSTGRQNRQCGGCIPCLLRRIALLSAGLPDEAYMMDILAEPQEHRGTDAYGNLVDLLTQAGAFLGKTDFELLIDFPQLLDLNVSGISVEDAIKTYKRHAAEVYSVLDQHFPKSAELMADVAW